MHASLDINIPNYASAIVTTTDLPAGKPPEYGRAVAVAVYDAMIATLNVPQG